MSKLILAAALVASGFAADALVFHPAADTTVARSFAIDTQIELTDHDLYQQGEPIQPEDISPTLAPDELGGSWRVEAAYSDEYLRTERGRALEFVRRFGDFLVDGEPQESDEEMPRALRFVWNADEERYDLSIEDEREPRLEDEQMLASMRADVDHTHLLPRGEVVIDDRWEVELNVAQFVAAAFPIMDGAALLDQVRVRAVEATADEAAVVMEQLFERIEEGFDDVTATLTYEGLRDDEKTGRTIGVLGIAIDHAFDLDLSDLLSDLLASDMENAENMEMLLELFADIAVEGEGELGWDVEANHLHHLDLPLALELILEGAFTMQIEDVGEFEFLSGSATWEGEANVRQTAGG